MQIKLGQGRLVTGYTRILHTIDLDKISQAISTLEELVQKFNNSGDFSKIIDFKIQKLTNEYKTILPKHSKKKKKPLKY